MTGVNGSSALAALTALTALTVPTALTCALLGPAALQRAGGHRGRDRGPGTVTEVVPAAANVVARATASVSAPTGGAVHALPVEVGPRSGRGRSC
jgi:hypothetical protein